MSILIKKYHILSINFIFICFVLIISIMYWDIIIFYHQSHLNILKINLYLFIHSFLISINYSYLYIHILFQFNKILLCINIPTLILITHLFIFFKFISLKITKTHMFNFICIIVSSKPLLYFILIMLNIWTYLSKLLQMN